MPNVSSGKGRREPDVPAICPAIDTVIEESGFTNRSIATELGTSEAAVGRWRMNAEPTRDQLAALERFLGLRLGHISKLAGYFEDVDADDLLAIIHGTHLFSDNGPRRIVLRVVEEMIDETKEERKKQANWRKRARR